MAVPSEKIALFIDGANLYATAKTLGFDIDYKRLLREFQSRGYLLRAFYYTAVIEDQEYSSIRALCRSHRAVLLRRLFPFAGRGDPAQGCAGHRGLHHLDPAADGGR